MTQNPLFDVVVVGAGLAGAATAAVLGRQGLRVALVDPRPVSAPAFKAEKIEPDQADLLRELGLMEEVRRRAAAISVIHEAYRGPFAFDALTCYPDTTRDRIDYVSLFAIPGGMRVNLFAYHEATDPWARALRKEPRLAMAHAFPWLPRLLGDYRVTSKIENRVIDLYVADAQSHDGVVMIGDAMQSVCPSTGTGLSKVLTDVLLLCEKYVPTWLRFPDLSAPRIAQFYRDPRKQACDWNSLEAAQYRRQLATDRSPLGWLRRRKTYAEMTLRGRCARLLGYVMAVPIALDKTM